MNLEDFLTPAETENGLTSVSRVEELISLIAKNAEKLDMRCLIHTLIATKDKDCLDRFVDLNGLHYLNNWLLEGSDERESPVSSILSLLERFPFDPVKLSAGQLRSTVEKLLDHKSDRIKEQARVLLDSWNQDSENPEINNNNNNNPNESPSLKEEEIKDPKSKCDSDSDSNYDLSKCWKKRKEPSSTEDVSTDGRKLRRLDSSPPKKEINTNNDEDYSLYGSIDALEVARQVARQVEREVVDYREPLCSSSSPEISSGEISDRDKPDLPINEPEPSTGTDHSDSSGTGTGTAEQDLESELVSKSEKNPFDFDLNAEVCTEETDLNPKSMVFRDFDLNVAEEGEGEIGTFADIPKNDWHFTEKSKLDLNFDLNEDLNGNLSGRELSERRNNSCLQICTQQLLQPNPNTTARPPAYYGYNGNYHAWTYQPGLYNYMVDPHRGVNFVPPVPTGTVGTGFPFVPSSSEQYGPSDFGLSLNSGERNGEGVRYRQFLLPAQNGSMDAQSSLNWGAKR